MLSAAFFNCWTAVCRLKFSKIFLTAPGVIWHIVFEFIKTAFYNMKHKQQNLNSIEKALKILLAFDAKQTSWGVRELSARLGFSPATIQRILQTLKAYDFIAQDEKTRQYRLGSIYYRFLNALQSNQPLSRAARPFMKHLLALTRETVHLNVVEGDKRICIDMLESPKDLKAVMPIGSRSPFYAGASSKCLIAFSRSEFIAKQLQTMTLEPLTNETTVNIDKLRTELAVIQKQGYAVSLGERNPGIGSLSVPVFSHRETLAASLSIALPEIRYKEIKHRKFCLQELILAAKRISQIMGGIP